MTRAEFTAAAAENRQVRLLDGTRAFYVDESYDPIVNDDGSLSLDTHSGETINVGDKLLTQLTTEPAMLTVGELRDLLGRYPEDYPAVLKNGYNNYGGIPAESIDQVLLRPHPEARPREARYREGTFAERTEPDTFEAVRIGHAAR